MTRIPGGHPEGYLEGFATIYTEAARAIIAHKNGNLADVDVVYPNIDDGLLGVLFIEAALKSAKDGNVWVSI